MEGQLYFHEFGSKDAPALLLIHGLGGGLSSWTQVATALSNHRRIIIPDLLGFGRSPWPKSNYTVDDHLDAIESLLASQGLDEIPLDVAGHSMGSILATELAARNPKQVQRLTLISFPYFPSADQARAHVTQYGLLARLTLGEYWGAVVVCGAMCLFRPLLQFVAPYFSRRLPAEVVRDALRHNFASFSRSLQNVVVNHRTDSAIASLSNRKVLLVHGERDGAAPIGNVRQLLQGLPAWKLEVLPDVGHYLPILKPDEIAAFIDTGLGDSTSNASNLGQPLRQPRKL